MYSWIVKQTAVAKNSTPRYHPKTEYFNKQMKALMIKGYARINARAIIRQALDKTGEIGAGPFTKINLRKTRRERSERLKVPFKPRYNGPIFKAERYIDEKGKQQERLIAQ